MAEHTKLPWRIERVSRFGEYDVLGANGEQVAACYITDGADEPEEYPSEANAAFIVKSCNAHDTLVKALNDLHVWCEVEGCGDQAEIIKDAFKAAGITEYRCSECDGAGEWDEGPLPARHSAQIDPEYRQVICPGCKGKGTISLASADCRSVGGEK